MVELHYRQQQQVDIVRSQQLLLDRGAEINLQDQDGETALHLAVVEGYIDVVQVFT
nr:ankyrin repeat domain-containing protein [Nostoc commune]